MRESGQRRRGRTAIAAVVVVTAIAVVRTGTDPETYTVSFDRQGGTGGSTRVTVTLGQPMPAALAPTKAGKVFDGYYLQHYSAPDGTGTQYYTAAMESAWDWDVPTDVELVAHWETYAKGDSGPAGGIVFYDKGEYTDGWRYLEAWTADEPGGYQWKMSSTSTHGNVDSRGKRVREHVHCDDGDRASCSQGCEGCHARGVQPLVPAVEG